MSNVCGRNSTHMLVTSGSFVKGENYNALYSFDGFLGGLSLHLNHLIQSRMEIS